MEGTTYKVGQDLVEDILKLADFGHVHSRSGDFAFNYCKNCNGPLLGHVESENECKGPQLDESEIFDIEKGIKANGMFAAMLASIDQRATAIKCTHCDVVLDSRLMLENHVKFAHEEIVKTADGSNDMSSLLKVMSEQSLNIGEQTKAIGKAVEQMMKNSPERKTTQITKAKPPPLWVGTDFERFRREVEAWEKGNKDDPIAKYHDFMESLKKNKEVKDYVITVVLDNTSDISTQTVKTVLDLLGDKFARTTTEKAKDVFDRILGFEMKEDETHEQYWDKFQSLIIDCDRENVRSKFNYLLSVLFIEKAKEKRKD